MTFFIHPIQIKLSTILHMACFFFLLCLLLTPECAFANQTGGGLPWDAPITKFTDNLTGKFAYALALCGIVGAGGALIFGGELSAFIRSILLLILVASILLGANAFITNVWGQGAEIVVHNSSTYEWIKEGAQHVFA